MLSIDLKQQLSNVFLVVFRRRLLVSSVRQQQFPITTGLHPNTDIDDFTSGIGGNTAVNCGAWLRKEMTLGVWKEASRIVSSERSEDGCRAISRELIVDR
jgi:hypothetical protein